MRRVYIAAISAFIFLASCNFMGEQIRGNGNITTREHKMEGIRGVDVSGAIEVILTQDSTPGVKVETDDNLHETISLEVRGGILEIHTRNNSNPDPTRGIKVYVNAPTLNRFSASGACSITSTNRITTEEKAGIDLSGASTLKLDIKAPAVDVGASGACNITLTGETKNLDIDGSGSTEVRAYDLMTENTNIQLSGAGTAEVFASVKLGIDLSGAANVRYKGNAAVSSETSGAASVKKVE